MKKLLFLFLFLASFGVVRAQPGNPVVNFRTTDPSGSCAPQPLWYNYSAGNLWGCQAGTWALLGSTSGGTVTPAAITASIYCPSSSASGTTYTCSATGFLAYQPGNFFIWKPDVNGTGGATTINISSKGAKSVTQIDGTTNPTSTDIVAGEVKLLEYDGTVFRMLDPLAQLIPSPVTNTATSTVSYIIKFNDGGVARSLKSKPNAESKRIVSIGSSVCAGITATTYANSWMGLLTAQQSGYAFINSCVSGNTTANMITNFYTDVAPLLPDYVIIAGSIVNETGGGTPTQAAARTFMANEARLVKMIEGIGAVPIIAGPNPNGAYYTGTVNTSGTAVTWVSGDQFPTNGSWPTSVSQITINSVLYTISAVVDATHLTLSSTAGTQSGVASLVSTGWTAAGCGLVRDLYDQFETWGVQVWDLLDPAVNTSSPSGCAYQVSLSYGDGLHPNNAGYAALYSAVNYDYLDAGRTTRQNIAPSAGQQSLKYGSDTSNAPFQVIAADGIVSAPSNLSSFTTVHWVRDAGLSASVPIYWHAEGSTGPVRIRSSNQAYQLTDGTTSLTSTTPSNNQGWHQLGVTYNYPANIVCFYTDGVQTGCSSAYTQFQATGFDFLGRSDSTANNCAGCYLGPVQVYRAPLDSSTMKDLFAGRVRTRSLVYSSGLGTIRTWEFNEANTGWVGEPFTGTNGMTNGGVFNGGGTNSRGRCDIIIGDTTGSALTNAQLGPQKRLCEIQNAVTIIEIDVSADAGTPNVIVGANAAGSVSNLTSSALATAASGGIACSNIGTNLGVDRATTCSGTLQNTSVAAGSYLELVSGTAGGTAKLMTIHILYINATN